MFSARTISQVTRLPVSKQQATLQFVRGKRTKGVDPAVQRIITQLSVMSAARKQPKMLKLCNEDYVKHQTISKAWSLIRKEKKARNSELLSKQLDSIKIANEDLKNISPKLFESANQTEWGKRFPLELRVPTEFPPRQLWYYDYVPTVNQEKK
ncbi:unnamed protein product [[Candida] boidinii]|uniref:Large ribosomal subunit protein mL40 n=1 Tax=Candida boidinii TaxID=5477 RepID=A0A9W6W9P5_CANBO|nr:hypothetical protein BVG19_g574 [[Candida] boidinii]OWB51483.1 hypothetical protein B5S27_g3046 [[Candida] boidinii]OWB65584.1 hypothetical protein B5S30_g910 [[Candida] boidinii]OWB84472.1 hypothetical protein B5S33_g3118 [[Candida] boidinii]GME70027.1 unnamed protein product [[Candida] boidinii]